MPTPAKDFKIKKTYTKLIEKKLLGYLKEFIFQPLIEILDKPKIALNSIGDIEVINEALKAGVIYYAGDEFIAKNKFSNRIASILEKWGARFNKYKKTYSINKNNIPDILRVQIAKSQIEMEQKYRLIDEALKEIQTNLDKYIDSMIFNEEVETILDDANGEMIKNTKKIAIIEPELTKKQKEEIAKNYTNNLQFYIKDFEEEDIPKMRSKIQELALKGYRADSIEEMILKEYSTIQKKAKFLAQNETSIMLSEYKKTQYQKMGSIGFIWNTIMDGKEREEHKKLNGKFFTWDSLPEIDEKGTRGLPGQTYNCRCGMTPVFEDNLKFKL